MPATRDGGKGSYLTLLSDLLQLAGSADKTKSRDRESDAPQAPSPSASAAATAPLRRRRASPPSRLLASLHPSSPFWHVTPRPHHHPRSAMPPSLSFNAFVHHGYRAPGATPWACVCSWATWHNESFNIHSHLLPLVGAGAALAVGLVRPWPAAPAAWALTTLPAALCLAGSVAYHTLMPAHDRYRLWLALDLSGVFLLFVAGMAPLLWWGFACFPTLRAGFMSLYYACAAAAVYASLRASSPAARAAPMAGLAGVRAATLVARAWLGAGAPAALPHYLAMEALSIAGALVNVARWPEKWVDGHRRRRDKAAEVAGSTGAAARHPPPHLIDFAFNSHNLMHVSVIAALIAYGRGAAAEYEWFHGAHGGGGAALCAAAAA